MGCAHTGHRLVMELGCQPMVESQAGLLAGAHTVAVESEPMAWTCRSSVGLVGHLQVDSQVAGLPAAEEDLDVEAQAAGLGAGVLRDTAPGEAVDPSAMAKAPCEVAAADEWAGLDTAVVEVGLVAVVREVEPVAVAVAGAPAVAAVDDLFDRMDSLAEAAFAGFEDQPVYCRPSCCPKRVVEEQGQAEVGFVSVRPIAGQVVLHQEHRADRPEGARLAEEVRRLG